MGFKDGANKGLGWKDYSSSANSPILNRQPLTSPTGREEEKTGGDGKKQKERKLLKLLKKMCSVCRFQCQFFFKRVTHRLTLHSVLQPVAPSVDNFCKLNESAKCIRLFSCSEGENSLLKVHKPVVGSWKVCCTQKLCHQLHVFDVMASVRYEWLVQEQHTFC